jgi:hypothetical protein
MTRVLDEDGKVLAQWYLLSNVPVEWADAARLALDTTGHARHAGADRRRCPEEPHGKEHTEVRYYILSRYLSGPDFANAVVAHWGIENNLHWQLDVTFGEDQCRLRKGHSEPTSLSCLERL